MLLASVGNRENPPDRKTCWEKMENSHMVWYLLIMSSSFTWPVLKALFACLFCAISNSDKHTYKILQNYTNILQEQSSDAFCCFGYPMISGCLDFIEVSDVSKSLASSCCAGNPHVASFERCLGSSTIKGFSWNWFSCLEIHF